MMIKIFTLNKNNKIEISAQELEKLLNESFWEGYNKNNTYTYTYKSPYISTTPYYVTTADCDRTTISGSKIATGTVTINSAIKNEV